MIVLGLDSSTRSGSLALLRDEVVVAERAGDAARTHGERLPQEIAALLAEFALTVHDVALYGVVAGPGSFTGLRAGIATIQGLALVHGRRVVPVSALEILAWQARSIVPDSRLAVWIDGQRGEVFAALYGAPSDSGSGADPATGLVEIESPMVGKPGAVLEAWRRQGDLRADPPVFIGDGVAAHRELLESVLGSMRILDASPLAGAAARLARIREGSGGAMHPHAIVPIYIRRPDAELAREKAHGRG
jgi:tRNA threonylcarbamoyladenosine biosynthesis protein TsaB